MGLKTIAPTTVVGFCGKVRILCLDFCASCVLCSVCTSISSFVVPSYYVFLRIASAEILPNDYQLPHLRTGYRITVSEECVPNIGRVLLWGLKRLTRTSLQNVFINAPAKLGIENAIFFAVKRFEGFS